MLGSSSWLGGCINASNVGTWGGKDEDIERSTWCTVEARCHGADPAISMCYAYGTVGRGSSESCIRTAMIDILVIKNICSGEERPRGKYPGIVLEFGGE